MTKRFQALFIVFVYECVKLAGFTELLALFLFSNFAAGGGGAGVPAALVFACAGGSFLFPLMAFFLWFDTERYGAFTPLYTAGKLGGAFCALAAAFFFIAPVFPFNPLILTPEGAERQVFIFALGLSISALTDTAMAFFITVTLRGARRKETAASSRQEG